MKITKPFLMLNTKSYLYGEELYDLAKHADKLVEKFNFDFFMTVPATELYRISQMVKNVIVTAQHMDPLPLGKGMGKITAESIIQAGAQAVVLNHAENPLTFEVLENTLQRARESNLLTIVCADTFQEAEQIAKLKPTIILCEPTELIGTGQISDENYIKQSNEVVKKVDSDILVMQGAGITSEKDIYRNLELGADGNGVTSGVVAAKDPKEILSKIFKVTSQFIN